MSGAGEKKADIQKFVNAGNITKEEISQLNSFGIALKQVFVQNMIIWYWGQTAHFLMVFVILVVAVMYGQGF